MDTTAEHPAVAAARTFAAEFVAPNARGWEEQRRFPREAIAAAGDAGLTGLLVPEALGGAGASPTVLARAMEELAAADFAFAFALVVHNNLAANIARNGTDAHKERHLPAMVAGRRIGAFLLTEPGMGSDAAAVATRARRDGGGWRIEGEKAWVTNAAAADILSVYAQTDTAAGWRGIACFLVDAGAEGVSRTEPYSLLGGHAMGAGGIALADVAVPEEAMLLGPGDGFKAAMGGIDLARATLAAMMCGMMRAGLECAIDYAASRRAFGQSTAEFQGVQFLLADAATDLEAARLLAYEAITRVEAGAGAAPMAAHAKKFATRAALARLADCMQAMGANGARADYPLARHLAGAKLAQFMDGTTEIQNVVIARHLLKGRG